MSRKGSWALLIAVCVLGLVGCATAPMEPVPLTAAPCVETTASQFDVTVRDDATVDPDCVIVKKGKTDIVWKAEPSVVATLTVKFPASSCDKPPKGLVCSGATCTLDKAKQASKGVFEYLVYVVKKDGTTAGTDPVLIIKP